MQAVPETRPASAGWLTVDSSGPGQFAGAYTSACNHGGNLKIVQPARQPGAVTDAASAIESFSKRTAPAS
jgi:hypothetical protein